MAQSLSELALTKEQEKWVKEWLYKWGAWVRSGRLDKRQVNIIARLMESVQPAHHNEPMCDDDEGLMISRVIDDYFTRADKELHFIVYGYYVNRLSINRLATLLFHEIEPRLMRPCVGKSEIRKPSKITVKRYVQCRLDLANAIIHELLLTGFVILRKCAQNRRNVKVRY